MRSDRAMLQEDLRAILIQTLAFQAYSSRRERLAFGTLGETSIQEKMGLKGPSRLCSDPPVKQLILQMDEDKHFIIQDLDETHLLVSADSLDMIKQHLEEEVSHVPGRADRRASQLTDAIHHRLLLCGMSSSRRIPSSSTSDWASAVPAIVCCCYTATTTQDQLAASYN